MECAEITEAFKPLKVVSRPLPEVPDSGVLLKTIHAGVCHSDIHLIDDETNIGDGKVFRIRDTLGDKYSGLVLGHEICGEVVSVGPAVSQDECSLKEGDVVMVYPWRGCRQCEACSEGDSNLCENNNASTTEIGQGVDGGYGSHIAVPEWEICVKLPSSISSMVGCMLPCSGLTAYSAILKVRPHLDNAVRMRGVANLLVIGVGGVGTWCITILKHVFGDKNVRIVCADLQDEKLEAAVKAGADDTVKWEAEKSVAELVSDTTMSGFNKMDAAIDLVGSSKTFSTAMATLHKGGGLVALGLAGGEISVALPVLISNSISLYGHRTGTLYDLKSLVELLSVQGIENYPPIEVIKLEQINDYLDKLRKGELKGRAIIEYDSSNNN